MKRITMLFGAVGLTIALGACGVVDEHNDDRGKGDAPVESKDDSGADVINMPDSFANVAHKCDGAGHRVYVTREPNGSRQLAVIDDENCG